MNSHFNLKQFHGIFWFLSKPEHFNIFSWTRRKKIKWDVRKIFDPVCVLHSCSWSDATMMNFVANLFLFLSHEKWRRKAFATKTTPHSPPGLRSLIPWWHYSVFVAPCLVQTLCYSCKRVKNGELSIANAIMIPEHKKWSFQENLIYSYMMLFANPFQNLNSNYLSILLYS